MMPRFSVSLSFLFTEVPFMERFQAAYTAGFAAVESMFPYEYDLEAVAAELSRLQLRQVLFNLPAGDWSRGERGIAALPDRREEFRRGVVQALEAARRLDCPRLNCLVGLRDDRYTLEQQWATMVENLRWAAEELGRDGRTLLVEAVNTYDVPGFLLPRTKEVLRLLDEVGAPNTALQVDIYHLQRMEGNIVPTLRALLPRIGHIQIADPPERHQPGTGELRFEYILGQLDAMGYQGYVGLEYAPLGTTADSLGWIEAMGFSLPQPTGR
jgi:hydroxypyruvate isomerase